MKAWWAGIMGPRGPQQPGTRLGLPSQGRPGRRRFEDAIAVGLFFCLACLVTWPLIFDLQDAILGHERCTNLMHVWTYWAVHRGLADGEIPILFDYIFYPTGGNLVRLYGSDLLYPPLLSVAQPLLTPGTLFNLKMLFSMTVAPYGMFRLLRHLGLGVGPSAAGGALFSVTPYFMLESLNGVAELVSVEWIPFTVHALLRTMDSARLRDAAACALFAVLAVYASAYNAFFIAIFGVIAVAHRALSAGAPLCTRAHVKAAGLLMGLGIAGMIPFVALHSTGETATSLRAKQSSFQAETSAPTADASADLARFFRPGRNTIPEVFERNDGGRDEVYTTYTTYMGFVTLVLALIAISRRRPRLRLWTWSAIIFFLIALGPYLRVLGEPVTVGGHSIPLPSLFLYHYFPGFSVTARHTYRYVTMVHLSLAVLAAFGIQHLAHQARQEWGRRLIPLGLAGLALMEIFTLGPAPWPIPKTYIEVPAWYSELKKEPDPAAIIELPFTRNHLKDLQHYLYFQTVHEKPWIDGAMHFRVRPEALDYVRSVPLAMSFLAEHTLDRPMNESQRRLSLRLLTKRGYRFVLLHEDYFGDPTDAIRARHHLEDIFGEPIATEGSLKVFSIEMPEPVAGM